MPKRKRAKRNLRNTRRNVQVPSRFPLRRILLGIAVLFLALQAYPFYIHSSLGQLMSSWNAGLLWGVLKAVGQEVSLENTAVVTEVTRFVIIPECTIFAPLSLLVAGVLVFPSKASKKVQAILLGTFLLSVLNLFRLISLHTALSVSPGSFEPLHLFIWQPIMAIASLLLWGIWAERQTRYA